MRIEHIIVHHLEKTRKKGKPAERTKATLHLREDELGVTPAAEHLLEGLEATYRQKTGKAYGVFKHTSQFRNRLDEYLKEERQNFDFAAFSRESMKLFETEINKSSLATGGYVAFILYSLESNPSSKRYQMIVMLNDKRGTAIDPKTLEIRDVTHLVLDEVHLAARIDIEPWQSGSSDSYLSFVRARKSESVARYFLDFIGCADYTDAIQESRRLINAIETHCQENALAGDQALAVRATVYDYVARQSEDGRDVELAEISRQIDPENPNNFFNFANSDRVGLSSSFEPDLRTFHRLDRFYGRDSDLTIAFSTKLLGNRVYYDPNDGSLLIASLPDALKRQLDEAQ